MWSRTIIKGKVLQRKRIYARVTEMVREVLVTDDSGSWFVTQRGSPRFRFPKAILGHDNWPCSCLHSRFLFLKAILGHDNWSCFQSPSRNEEDIDENNVKMKVLVVMFPESWKRRKREEEEEKPQSQVRETTIGTPTEMMIVQLSSSLCIYP
jgi:hypothetical protein